jgi:hypothetical protein
MVTSINLKLGKEPPNFNKQTNVGGNEVFLCAI